MDQGLLTRARDGDRDAFELIVVGRGEALFRTAVAILGHEADAFDATQEALIASWQRLSTLRDPERFDAWLGRILVNECRMVLRRRNRVREIPLEAASERQSRERDPGGAEEAFDRAFGQLSVDQRALLVLHHHQGYGVREIAARMGITAGTVQWRLFRARRALEAALGEERS